MPEFNWNYVAFKHPELVEPYVQEKGPLPDGPVTKEAWDEFYAWAKAKWAEDKRKAGN